MRGSELRGFLRLRRRSLRLAELKLQKPGAGGSTAVDLCRYKLPVLRCVQGLVGEIAAWARPVEGGLGDIAPRIDLDTDSNFDVALNGAKDLSRDIRQGLVRNRSLDNTSFGGLGRWGSVRHRLRS